jgi:hypothetical protein
MGFELRALVVGSGFEPLKVKREYLHCSLYENTGPIYFTFIDCKCR